MEKHSYKYVIIGGGISGLITSIELAKSNPGEVLLVEKELELGGQLQTIKRNKYSYDMGSHIIHDGVDTDVLEYINIVSGGALVRNVRIGKLILRESFIDYPLKSIKFMSGLGFLESTLCILSLLKSRLGKLITYLSRSVESNYEVNLKRNVGIRAYNLFYEPYALKVWNCDPKKISNSAIKREMAMVGPISLLKELINYNVKKKHDKYYYYLEGGIGLFPAGLERIATENNITILKGIKNFTINGDSVEIEKSNTRVSYSYSKLISTIPINVLLEKFEFEQSERILIEKVDFRALKLIFIHINENVLIEGESFYLPETKYRIGRVSIPGRFSSSMQPKDDLTSVICEIPCSVNDEIWNMTTKEAAELSYMNLKNAGLIKGDKYITSDYNFTVNLPNVYPLYYTDWQNVMKSIFDILAKRYPNIYVSGKAGFFMQSNLDRSIEMSKELPVELLNGITPSDWYKKFDNYHNLILRD